MIERGREFRVPQPESVLADHRHYLGYSNRWNSPLCTADKRTYRCNERRGLIILNAKQRVFDSKKSSKAASSRQSTTTWNKQSPGQFLAVIDCHSVEDLLLQVYEKK